MTDSAEVEDAGPFTLPNLVTLLRLLCIPIFVILLLGFEDRVAAAILLAVLGATDWVDGYLARRLNQTSEIGKLLDPTADRLLFLVAVFAMIIDDAVPLVFALAVLAREIVISVTVLVLGALGARRIEVTWWGKTGTFGLMATFPMFLLGSSDIASAELWQAAAWMLGIPSLLISYYAAFAYIPLARDALREGRAARSENPDSPVEVESGRPGRSSETPPRAMG